MDVSLKRTVCMSLFLLAVFSVSAAGDASVSGTLDGFIDDYWDDPTSIVYGVERNYNDFLAAAIISAQLSKNINPDYKVFPRIVSDEDLQDDYFDKNLILVGGPCSNKISSDLLEPYNISCGSWALFEGESLIKVLGNGGKKAVIVAGSTEHDTLRAARVTKNFDSSPKLQNSDEVVYTRHMNIREAYNEIINDYRVNDDLIIIAGDKGASADFPAALELAQDIFSDSKKNIDRFPQILTPEAVKDRLGHNLILIGGPCANGLTEDIISEAGYNCDDWMFEESEGVIKIISLSDKIILFIAGTSEDPKQTLELIRIMKDGERYPLLEESSGVVVRNGELEEINEKQKNGSIHIQTGLAKALRELFIEGESESSLLTAQKDIDYIEYLENKDSNKNCYSCFMDGQSRDYVFRIMDFLGSLESTNGFTEAERRYILGKITEDVDLTCSSIGYYKDHLRDNSLTEDDRLIVYENILFLSTECLSEREQYFYLSKVIDLCNSLGYGWKTGIYARFFHPGDFEFEVEKTDIIKNIEVPPNPKKLILGRSFIEVDKEDIIGMQVERTTRDWLSLDISQFPNKAPDFLSAEGVGYMEGDIVRRIVESVKAQAVPLPNTLIVKKETFMGSKWYATDEKGAFRFEVLPDKVQYPTTKCYKNICLLVDTHGISSLVAQSLKKNVTLVVGCGDYYDKMTAAHYLSNKGVDVLYPCDRFAGEIIGNQGKGTVIGTAPLKNAGNTAIIGDQPIEISLNEVIVVQTTNQPYPAQYYDAPLRYFSNLEKTSGLKMKLEIVETNNLRETYKVIDKAKEIEAKVVAVRVAYKEDHDPVKAWLSESKENRAVLFHSAPYEYGYRLFEEFPEQTSFGDSKPIFE